MGASPIEINTRKVLTGTITSVHDNPLRVAEERSKEGTSVATGFELKVSQEVWKEILKKVCLFKSFRN